MKFSLISQVVSSNIFCVLGASGTDCDNECRHHSCLFVPACTNPTARRTTSWLDIACIVNRSCHKIPHCRACHACVLRKTGRNGFGWRWDLYNCSSSNRTVGWPRWNVSVGMQEWNRELRATVMGAEEVKKSGNHDFYHANSLSVSWNLVATDPQVCQVSLRESIHFPAWHDE
jgi:hypothetical protein